MIRKQNSTDESARIGVYVCHCGTNIAGVVDVEEVSNWAGEQPNVVCSRDYKFMCSSLGQELIEEDIKELLNFSIRDTYAVS